MKGSFVRGQVTWRVSSRRSYIGLERRRAFFGTEPTVGMARAGAAHGDGVPGRRGGAPLGAGVWHAWARRGRWQAGTALRASAGRGAWEGGRVQGSSSAREATVVELVRGCASVSPLLLIRALPSVRLCLSFPPFFPLPPPQNASTRERRLRLHANPHPLPLPLHDHPRPGESHAPHTPSPIPLTYPRTCRSDGL